MQHCVEKMCSKLDEQAKEKLTMLSGVVIHIVIRPTH